MFKQGCWLLLLSLVAVAKPNASQAEFSFNLNFNGRGSVMAFLNGNSSAPSEILPTTPNPLSSSETQVLLDAVPLQLDITDVIPPTVDIAFGEALNFSLPTTLGSKFLFWSGELVVPTDPADPGYQDPNDSEYKIQQPNPNAVQSITANFEDVPITSVEFSFDLQNTWVSPSSWNFTGDDDPSNLSPSGNTLININWNDLVGRIDLNGTTRVDLRILAVFDSYGSRFQYLDGFDLNVNSSAAVPEPASWALVAVGAAGAALWRKRKRGRGMGK